MEGYYSNEGFAFTCSCSCSIESASFDLMKELLSEQCRHDLVIEDEDGNKVSIPNVEISTKIHHNCRIPRKIKKSLKKKYGLDWVYHRVGATQTISFEKK